MKFLSGFTAVIAGLICGCSATTSGGWTREQQEDTLTELAVFCVTYTDLRDVQGLCNELAIDAVIAGSETGRCDPTQTVSALKRGLNGGGQQGTDDLLYCLEGTSEDQAEAQAETDEKDQAEAVCFRAVEAVESPDLNDGPVLVLDLDPQNYDMWEGRPLGEAWEGARQASQAMIDDPGADSLNAWIDALLPVVLECNAILGEE